MAEKKIIAVIGATGAQGGGLVRAILNDPNGGFAVRAITRKKDSDKAKALAKAGAEVVEADLDDAASLKKAFAGAHGAFCVTNFWEHFNADKEQAQARNMADAARATGLKHVIWSTLEDVRRWVPLTDKRMPTLGGKWKVPHFDGKGSIDHVWNDLGVPTTLLLTSFYWENFIYFGMGPKKDKDGNLVLTLPMGNKKLPSIAVEDIGKCAYGIFRKGREFIGKRPGIAGEHLTGVQMATAFGRALGKQVSYKPLTPEQFRGLGFPGADDLGNMFQFYADYEVMFSGARGVESTRALNPALQTFDQWLAVNKDRIPID